MPAVGSEPLETAPLNLTWTALPPLMLKVDVVVNVEPAPVTTIVEAVSLANSPVMIAFSIRRDSCGSQRAKFACQRRDARVIELINAIAFCPQHRR